MLHPTQKTVAGRLVFLFLLTVMSVNVFPSEWLARIKGKPSLVPTKIEGLPLIVLALLLVAFVLLYRKSFDSADLGFPKKKQAVFGWASMLLLMLIVYNSLHPDYATLIALQAKAQNSSMFYASLLGGGFYTILLLPFVVGLFTMFRVSFLSSLKWPLVAIVLLTVFSIFGLFLEVQYFSFVYKPTMMLVEFLLILMQHPADIGPAYMQVSLANFSVNVGPACSGFRFATIFTILYGLVWFSKERSGNARHGRLFLLYLGGLVMLFVVNVLRIALIVLVGKYYPVFAAALFHNLIGTVLFLFVFYGYIKKVVLRYI